MRTVYEFLKRSFGIAVFAVILLGVIAPLQAQLTLVSTQPQDGQVNVATPATFVLTFSAPLDTSARFAEPEDFFLGILIFPEDATGEPADIQLSEDMRTVTVSGFPLTDDTKFSIIVTDAKSQSGVSLDRPYIVTFSTGSSLPSGSFSGQVNFAGGNPNGAVVVLFGEGLFNGEPIAAGVANSSYTVNYVPNGTYFPMALKDTNGDGLDPTSGDALGFYDSNADQRPDPIVISGGNSISGVNLEMFQPAPQTARNNFDAAEAAASDWAVDAHLILANGNLDPLSGESFIWFFGFYSHSLQQFNVFMLFNDHALPGGGLGEELPDTSGVRVDWIDSDEMAVNALENGGSDFLAQNENVEASAFLGFPSPQGEGDGDGPNALARGKWGRGVFDRASRLAKAGNGSQRPVWFVNYFSRDTFQGISVVLDAETGEPVLFGVSAAYDNLGMATQSAVNWAGDAQLVNLQSFGIYPDGRAYEWRYGFFSTSRDSVRWIMVNQGQIVDESTQQKFSSTSLEPLGNWIDSPAAIAVADANSNDFRNTHPEVFVEALLSRGLLFDSRVIWRIRYSSFFSQQNLEIMVDATSGQFITNVEEESPKVPVVFELAQNYPNPFNPETVIKYSLAKSGAVDLAVYNLLGQKVRVLVSAIHPAGAHEINWNGRDEAGNLLPSGVYVYRLTAAEFTQTKKMILMQ
jgi:hypothetical protein